jgi:site-specific DNA-adenine methylase
MQNNSIKIINYAGTKLKFINEINNEINKSNKLIYVEPFLGSGAVFLNLEKDSDEYILNDLDENVIRIFNSFKNGTWLNFLKCKRYVWRN